MPRKKAQRPPPVIEDYPDPDEISPLPAFDEEPEPASELELPRQSRKKHRNVHTTSRRLENSSSETTEDEQVAVLEPSPSPLRNTSLLSQVNFPSYKSRPVNIREEIVATEKVSDQYTPPSDGGLVDNLYGRSPQSVAISSAANTPPVESGFASRPSFKARSPPISPPQRNARPVSFGGSVPPIPAYSRYPLSNYGSPPTPAPPHLPQPHFYAAHDIDLGVPAPGRDISNGAPVFTKYVQLSTFAADSEHGVASGYAGRLNICSFNGSVIHEIGVLSNLQGVVVDAELLRWTSGIDPFADFRPLVAITSMRSERSPAANIQHSLHVSVYSMSRQEFVLDLLQTPPEPSQHVAHGRLAGNVEPCNHLRLNVASNFLSVSSGRSGEIFIFCPTVDGGSASFECLGKFWTTIQPNEQRRDSSHHRLGTPDCSALDYKKVISDDNVPVMSMMGRWLAVCPPTASSYHSIGAKLGDHVIARRHAGLEAMSPSTRPVVNCDVDSPDADTLFGKVARVAAQEVMKAGKWLGDQGMQYWQSYWKRDDPTRAVLPQPAYTNIGYQNQPAYGHFPPTHADISVAAKDLEVVSIFDLKSISDPSARRPNALVPLATFQPPHGCSFLSFAPHGLSLLTASRKGDYQYIWDLLEIKHSRALSSESDNDGGGAAPRVRQLARFDRLSGSVIVDVAWEKPSLARVAILTKNKTVHLFDLPASAMRWPPPRKSKKGRPVSAPPTGAMTVEHEAAPSGGFFASAMNFAGRTQPVLANLRGRTPSAGGGFAGIGQAGFGIATATGARGSKAVAAGLSKSLGAATETVSRLQHAGDNKLHLKSENDVSAGQLVWIRRASKAGICVLGENGLKYYQVRKSKPRDQRHGDLTVFEARRAVAIKQPTMTAEAVNGNQPDGLYGFWSSRSAQVTSTSSAHPLSFAEIDTNAPFQPFHSDRRVTLSVFESEMKGTQLRIKASKSRSPNQDQWMFGDDIPSLRLNTLPAASSVDENLGSVIYRETTVSHDKAGDGEQIVSTTRRRKPNRGNTAHADDTAEDADVPQEGFFEDDCDVLDFASDRV